MLQEPHLGWVRRILDVLQGVAVYRNGALVAQQYREAIAVAGSATGEPDLQLLFGGRIRERDITGERQRAVRRER
ncbi:MAG: hypothetical protein EBV06_07855 [Planctomycetia bacterium]|nr:hypothetical protein [Planctomycetia bacterium]